MKFCIKCDNMYYIKIHDDNENQLMYYCRNCGHVDDLLSQDGICVLNTYVKKGAGFSYENHINPYTKLDPTLPRIYTMKCPNESCNTNKETQDKNPTEILYIRYNDQDMKYMYMCVECDFTWKTDEIH